MEKKITGFVVKKVEYKENDSIITVYGNDSFLYTFKARGIAKQNSKNGPSCNYFVISDYLLSSNNNQVWQLKSASIVSMYKKPYESLQYAGVFLLIIDIVNQIANQVTIYDNCIELLDKLENGENEKDVLINFYKLIVNKLGYTPLLGKCVFCESKENIVSFSFKEGGFICSKCFSSDYYVKMDKKFLEDLFMFLKSNMFYRCNTDHQDRIITMFHDFISDEVGLILNNQIYNLAK